MKKKLLLTFSLFLCVLGMWGQAVTDVGTFEALQSALSSDGSYIRLTADITVTSLLTVPNGTTIDGDGHVLSVPVPYLNEDGSLADSPSSFGVFYIASSSIVTLRNMKLLGGSGYAAVTNYGSLTMENITMTLSNRGLNNSGKAVMNNCNLVRCAAEYGGGVLNSGQIVMNGCSYTENRDRINSSTWGGGGAAENQGTMYLNNTTMSNNLSDECGAAINNYGGRLYIMNSTISGNTAVGSYNVGALRDNSGPVYAVNSIIADNKHITNTGTGTVTESDIKSSGTYINCVLGTSNAGTQTGCKIATTDGEGIFAEYYNAGMYANGDSYTTGFSRTVLVKDGDSYSAPVSSTGLAKDGATQSYFNSYIDASGNLVITMCYNSGTAESPNIVSLIPSGSTEVTGLTPNKNNNDPIGAGATVTSSTHYYTVTRGDVINGTMTGVSLYGDSYVAGTSVTVEATPASGYAFAGWTINGSEMVTSTSNPYTFEVLQDIQLSPRFGLTSQTIVATVEPFVGVYDGNDHNISVNVTTPSDGYTITYSETEDGEYTLTPPSISAIGVHNIYYKVEASGYNTLLGYSTVSITGAYAVLSDEDGDGMKTLTFYYDNLKDTRTGTVFTSAQFPTTYNDSWLSNAATITTVTFDNSFANYTEVTRTARWFYKFENLTAINGIANLNTQNVTNMSQMFYNCKKLATLDVTHFNTSQVQYFGGMFENCESLVALDLSLFDTSNALYMSDMFKNCRELTTLDLSSFNTSKVIGMSAMFYQCDKLTSITFGNHFDTSNVEYMNSLFAYCRKLETIDLSGFNTSKVMGMNSMFNDCIALTNLDISSFDTRKVTDMGYMFSGCSLLETLTFGDNFNTAAVTNMGYLFANCGRIEAIDLSKFSTEKVTNMKWMFHNCYKLASLDLSTFNTSKVTNMSRMFASNDALTSLDISNFNTSLVTTMEEMFSGSYRLLSLTIGSDFTIAGITTISNMFWNCTALASGTLTVKGTTAPSIGQDIFSNVFTDGTLTVDGGVTMDDLAVGSADEDSHTYTTWKGGRFNKTFFRDFAFTASDWRTWYGGEDLTANIAEMETYVVTGVTDNSVILRETNGEIYQNTPMLLKRKDNTLTSVRGLAPTTELAPPTDTDSRYIGGVSDLSPYASQDVYILVGEEFVRADLSNSTTFNSTKCFLALASAAASRLRIGTGDATGMETVRMTDGEDAWYTIGGRKLGARPAKKGLYIHNGKKVTVK